jgi:hypothetical protein
MPNILIFKNNKLKNPDAEWLIEIQLSGYFDQNKGNIERY